MDQLGITKVRSHYHKFYFYFNLTELELGYYKLLSNIAVLDSKIPQNSTINGVFTILKDNCDLFREQLSKFTPRVKRSLLDGLGTIIKYITGNPDNNDLKEINKNLDILFKNQDKLLKQINKQTSFANHITERYSNDIKSIQTGINLSIQTINTLSSMFETQSIVQYSNHMARKLLNTLQMIERTISLASSNIVNLEVISNSELISIIDHVRSIYKQTELLDLDTQHLFTILDFSKVRIVSVSQIITCILYIPILNPTLYRYSRIYPIPNSQDKVIIPPAKYYLLGEEKEFWTEEDCKTFRNQTICIEEPRIDKCSLVHDIHDCICAIANNNYRLFTQLKDGKILISSKLDINIVN
ncbi:uncharacterized protein LOC116163835 [Photinus pyralis]|uniref:uncharacterized protein LOC116163835 n=1 Tax=Photinus pyralis TaxID=7054 RepID=UPI0012675B4A|nr:uncharacterized protein LOC116163835 [Photinus pyralis]